MEENQKIIGFCLTDKDLIECAKNKLENKNLDFIIANDVKTALNTNENKVTIIEKSGKIIDIGLDSKINIARKIVSSIRLGKCCMEGSIKYQYPRPNHETESKFMVHIPKNSKIPLSVLSL